MNLLLCSSPVSDRRRVFLAVPSFGDLPPLTTFCLFQSHPELLKVVDIELGLLSGHCHVDDARNMLVKAFLDSDCDELMFIDADIGWQAEDLVRFIQHDRDVVAGIYPKKNDDEDYPCQLIPGDIWSDADGLIEVQAVPTGFLKVKRCVFEALADYTPKYRPSVEDTEFTCQYFTRSIVNECRVSGDYHFSHQWRKIGGSIHIDPEIHLDHIGSKRWDGSYGSYLRKQAGLDLVKWVERIKDNTFERQDAIELWYEWGGNNWAAGHELLVAAIETARQAEGPIIEIGSGLTSIAMAATGAEVYSLEHDPVWYHKVMEARDRLGLDNLFVKFSPLLDGWYSKHDVPWQEADMVLCDGPPRRLGERNTLYDVMIEEGCYPRIILQDDVRELDVSPIAGYDFEIMGALRRFAVLKRRKCDGETSPISARAM